MVHHQHSMLITRFF